MLLWPIGPKVRAGCMEGNHYSEHFDACKDDAMECKYACVWKLIYDGLFTRIEVDVHL